MFQSLANYLLGTSNQTEGSADSGVERHNTTRLRSVVSEDDWVVVDRDSEGNSDTSSVESFQIDVECIDGAHDPLSGHKTTLTRSSSTSSLPCTTNMEESWFLTPPPCFTSTGPVQLATSPLENLLIEHPSMSVYQNTFHQRRLFAPGISFRTPSPAYVDPEEIIDLRTAVVATTTDDNETVDDGDDDDVPLRALERRPRNNNRVHVLQQQERQCLKSKQAQKGLLERPPYNNRCSNGAQEKPVSTCTPSTQKTDRCLLDCIETPSDNQIKMHRDDARSYTLSCSSYTFHLNISVNLIADSVVK